MDDIIETQTLKRKTSSSNTSTPIKRTKSMDDNEHVYTKYVTPSDLENGWNDDVNDKYIIETFGDGFLLKAHPSNPKEEINEHTNILQICIHPSTILSNITMKFKPTNIILYDPTISMIRQIEIYQTIISIQLHVYFLMYEHSVEQQRYQHNINLEKKSFEDLIYINSKLAPPLDQDGKIHTIIPSGTKYPENKNLGNDDGDGIRNVTYSAYSSIINEKQKYKQNKYFIVFYMLVFIYLFFSVLFFCLYVVLVKVVFPQKKNLQKYLLMSVNFVLHYHLYYINKIL
jgi:hypothetical protein